MLHADPAYGYARAVELEITLDGKSRNRKFPKRDQFAAELVYFSDCILKDKDPEPSGTEGLIDVRIIQAIYESIRTRQTVRLAEPVAKKLPRPGQTIHGPGHDRPKIVNTNLPSHAA
jgi:predicted dehydrogenase